MIIGVQRSAGIGAVWVQGFRVHCVSEFRMYLGLRFRFEFVLSPQDCSGVLPGVLCCLVVVCSGIFRGLEKAKSLFKRQMGSALN